MTVCYITTRLEEGLDRLTEIRPFAPGRIESARVPGELAFWIGHGEPVEWLWGIPPVPPAFECQILWVIVNSLTSIILRF